MKQANPNIRTVLWVVGISLALIALSAGLVLLGLHSSDEMRFTTVAPTTQGMATVTTKTPPSVTEDPIVMPDGTIDLGSGLKLTALSSASGNFPEDGSDAFALDMLSAAFTNMGTKTLQYAKINATIGERVYTFEISTLPVGKTVRAFEMNRAKAPEGTAKVTAEAELVTFFDEEPTRMTDRLEFTVNDGHITVKNISDEDMIGELSVYFKNTFGDTYMGGITYRVRIVGLKAGESVSGYSSHAYAGGSEVMFVQYVES